MVRKSLLAFFLLTAPAMAQSSAVLGRDDAAFARGLYLSGWTDLAEGVVKVFTELDQQGKADPLEALAVKAVGYDLKMDVAMRDTDVDRRKAVMAEVIAAKEKLIADSPRTEVARVTRDNLPDAYRLYGDALTAALEKETDPNTQAKLREEGQTAFARAENELKERIESLKDVRLEENRTAEDVQYMNALFNLGRTRYFHAQFYPKGHANGELLYNIAITAFEDLGLEYPGRLIYFEGTYFVGLCHKALGKNDEAIEDWNYNIDTLRESTTPDTKGRYSFQDELADIVSRNVLQKVQLLSEIGKHAEAVAAADDYWTKTVNPEGAISGLAVLAAKAEAQLAASDVSGAGDTAKRLMELNPNGQWGAKGRQIQLALLGGGGSTIGPLEILKAAQQLHAQGKVQETLEAARQALLAAKGDAKEAEVGSQALFLMGEVYRKSQRFFEATLAYDNAFERYPKGVATPDAVAQSMNCYRKLNTQEKRPYFKTRVDERGATLVREFPNHPAVSALQLGTARDLKDEGKFEEAAQRFRSVPATASAYAEAQMEAGACLYLFAKALLKEKKLDLAKSAFADAESQLKKALAEIAAAKPKSLDQQVQNTLSAAEYTALTTLSKLYLEESVAKPDLVLSTLQGVDERFATDGDAIAFLWQLRIRAWEKLGRIDEAVAKFDELWAAKSDPARLAGPASVLSRSLDQRAVDLAHAAAEIKDPTKADEAKKKADAAMKMWRKSVDLYTISVQPQLDNRSNARAKDLEDVSKRLLDLGMKFNGVPDTASTFVGWKPVGSLDRLAWDAAAKIYDAV
ncbi:MAG TPA: hypothetical protein VM509_09520, partial [Planctomycetota bacterium]|nr:hypothetical protein [Planctomycetota bacterium]